MAKNKIYSIETDFTKNWNDVLNDRQKLGHAIVTLAKSAGEEIHFHDYKDPVCGAPVILLECSQAFLDQVKNLPECKNVQDFSYALPTFRAQSIKDHFEGITAYAITFAVSRRNNGNDKMTQVFNFQSLMKNSKESYQRVVDHLRQKDLLKDVADIRCVPNEGRMLIQCTEDVINEIKNLPCVGNVSHLTANEIAVLGPRQPPKNMGGWKPPN